MQHLKLNTVLSAIMIIIIVIVGSAITASDNYTRSGDISRTGAHIKVNADNARTVSAAGAAVIIKGTVSQDIWAAGASLEIDTQTGGNLHAAGARVNLFGSVDGFARMAGAELSVNAEIEKALNVIGASVFISEDSKVGPYSSIVAALLEFHGQADDALTLYGDEILFTGQTAGSLDIEGRMVSIGENAIIGGDLTIRSVEKADVHDSINVGGKITKSEITLAEFNESDDIEDTLLSNYGGKLIIGASAFLLGLLLILFTGKTSDQMTGLLRAHPGKSLVWGLAIFFGLPLLFIICLVTVVGIPIGLSSLFLIPFLTLLGFTAALLGLSDFLLSKSGKPKNTKFRVIFLALSVLIYYLIRLIPIIGALIVFIAMLLGLGAAIVTIGNRIKDQEQNLKTEQA